MSKHITIKNTNLDHNELTRLIEENGGNVEVKEIKKKGRPKKYETREEYRRSCNKQLKFKDMTLEKALKQQKRYEILLNEINDFISKQRQESDSKDPIVSEHPLSPPPSPSNGVCSSA